MTGAQAAMDLGYTLWLFAVSLGASALGGVLGMASGIFIVPILTMFGHLDIHIAIGASIVSVIACSCGGAAPFLRGRLTNVRLAVVLETATTLGALSGVLLSGLIPVSVLFFIFAVILLVSAQQMLARRADPVAGDGAAVPGARSWGASLRLDSSYPDRALGHDVDYRVQRVPLGLSLMYGAGLISALLGIGSGVLKIPAMDTALRLPIKVSSATSNFMIGVTAAASAGAYFLRGEIVAAIAGPVALGSVVGALLGARVLTRLSGDRLRVLFVVVLAVLAVQMLLEAFGIHLFGASA
ncbi:sulfite exporter TauE/SafE family protein [Paraburkholderia agricolaris]|uniref:sulfite exporter TauE/SafE family protein n=1 Tax=Paraburkholderia agricolaris TaxID=2152888 RepID=UPI001FE9EF57|nr:sulfite exporter TauE/SafE family protein [Paraburkholderia agricolaris]